MSGIEPTAEERAEALSHIYVDAARIVALQSGRFAVFSMARGHLLACVEAGELSQWVIEACRISGESWIKAKAEELAERNLGPPVALKATAEDLGL